MFFNEGYNAAIADMVHNVQSENPYTPDSQESQAWEEGYRACEDIQDYSNTG